MATSQSKFGRRFDEEFKREVAALACRPGARQEQVARDLGVSPYSVSRWKKLYGGGEHAPGTAAPASAPGVSVAELERRIRALERENADLRDARLAQARAIRRTTIPGRREQALAALAEAAQIRPGSDLLDGAIAALMLFDVKTLERWPLDLGGPTRISLDPMGTLAATERVTDSAGSTRGAASLRKWGRKEAFVTLAASGGSAVGAPRFSPDGAYLMESFSDGNLRVWRVGETTPFLTLPLPVRASGGRPTRMCNEHYAFTPDNRFIALGLPGRGVSLRRLPDGAETARWEDGDVFDVVTVSPDGRDLATESLDESRPAR